jgi:membrane protein
MASRRLSLTGVVKKSASEFSEDDCAMMAAALSYYTAFSLPPLLVLVVTAAGWIWSPEAVSGQVERQVADVIGEGGWQQVEAMMQAAGDKTRGGWAAVAGIAALLFGATGVMIQLQSALNKAWEVQPDPKAGGIRNFVLKRMLSLGMIMAVAFLLVVSLVLTAVLNAAGSLMTSWLPEGMADWIPLAVNFFVSLVVFTLLFAAMFKWLPDAEMQWKDTWIGAATTSLLFMLGKFLMGLYFSMTDAETYGTAASFVLLLLWVYYSGMIFLFGAEFTQVWAKHRGAGIAPDQGAVRVVEKTERIGSAAAVGK